MFTNVHGGKLSCFVVFRDVLGSCWCSRAPLALHDALHSKVFRLQLTSTACLNV